MKSMKCVGLFLMGIILVLWFTPLHATLHETLPTWHWAYEYIDALQKRGEFQDLFAMNRPYTRGDVAKSLIQTESRISEDTLSLTQVELKLLNRLMAEFQAEVNEIQGEEADRHVSLGMRVQGGAEPDENDQGKYSGVYRGKISIPIGKHVSLYNGTRFNHDFTGDSSYIGKPMDELLIYTEQAYLSAEIGRFRFKAGRDFIRWGPGYDGTLMFSNIAQPFDFFQMSARLGPLQYTFLTSILDRMELSGDEATEFGGDVANRFLSAYRLDLRLLRGRLQFAWSEAVIYGGPGRNAELRFHNPFLLYYLSRTSRNVANTMGVLEFTAYPTKGIQLYGSLLVDHLKGTGDSDIQPNEIGWQIGSQIADPFRLHGLTVSAEYTGITNRTYKTKNPWERFTHHDITLGHPLTHDFDRWRIDLSQWVSGFLKIKAGYGETRKGEGDLFAAWDRPWAGLSDVGYSEPFPTGVVENRKEISVQLRVYPSAHWGLEFDYCSINKTNADHVLGEERTDTIWRVGVWLDGGFMIAF